MDLTTNCSTARRASLRARSSTTAIPIRYSDKIGGPIWTSQPTVRLQDGPVCEREALRPRFPSHTATKLERSCVIPTMEIRKRMEFSRLRLTKQLKGTHTGKVMVNNVIQIVRKYHTNSFHGLPG